MPRVTLMKRFPLPKNLGVDPASRVEPGRRWPAPVGAKRLKAFEIYCYDPDSGRNPRIDAFEVDLDLDQEQDRLDRGFPCGTFRSSTTDSACLA
jgi:hypothetical protein